VESRPSFIAIKEWGGRGAAIVTGEADIDVGVDGPEDTITFSGSCCGLGSILDGESCATWPDDDNVPFQVFTTTIMSDNTETNDIHGCQTRNFQQDRHNNKKNVCIHLPEDPIELSILQL
jgi:hypothetical protein